MRVMARVLQGGMSGSLRPNAWISVRHCTHRPKHDLTMKIQGKVQEKVIKPLREDPPLLLVNCGAVLSLTGFMMTDMLTLRTLSLMGGCCGMVYNFTRKPKQLNAVGWGLVFASVNAVNIIRLLLERSETKMDHREFEVYQDHFQEFGVEPHQFVKLMHIVTWKDAVAGRGDLMVQAGQPFKNVIMIHRGVARCFEGETDNKLYDYHGDGQNGAVIGGTALVDHMPTERLYPNNIRPKPGTSVSYLEWDREELSELLAKEPALASALIMSLYVDLLKGLRHTRHVRAQHEASSQVVPTCIHKDAVKEASSNILAYRDLLMSSLEGGTIDPKAKRRILQLKKEYRIAAAQHNKILELLGWSHEDWICGEKEC